MFNNTHRYAAYRHSKTLVGQIEHAQKVAGKRRVQLKSKGAQAQTYISREKNKAQKMERQLKRKQGDHDRNMGIRYVEACHSKVRNLVDYQAYLATQVDEIDMIVNGLETKRMIALNAKDVKDVDTFIERLDDLIVDTEDAIKYDLKDQWSIDCDLQDTGSLDLNHKSYVSERLRMHRGFN